MPAVIDGGGGATAGQIGSLRFQPWPGQGRPAFPAFRQGITTGATITSNGTGGGNSSVGSSWLRGVAPRNGDLVVIQSGDTIAVDQSIIWGSNQSKLGHAFTINGTNASTFGTIQVNSGVTLTLRGYDVTSNTLGLINQFALFQPLAGSTIVGDVTGDLSSLILNKGLISALGTISNPITFTSPAGNYSWNNTASAEAWNAVSGSGWVYDPATMRACASFVNDRIANAAGTRLGNMADQNSGSGGGAGSAVTFGGTDAGSFTNPVAIKELVSFAGDYFIDFMQGLVYFHRDNTGSSPSFTKTYKYLTLFRGWAIDSSQNTASNAAVYDWCNFSYMGSGTTDTYVLTATSKKSSKANGGATTSDKVDRLFKLTNSTFNYCKGGISIKTCTGTFDDPLIVQFNTFNRCQINTYRASSTYVKIDTNIINGFGITATWDGTVGGVLVQTGWTVANNSGVSSGFFVGSHPLGCTFPGTVISSNTMTGVGQAVDSRTISGVGGAAGNVLTITGNHFAFNKRTCHLGSYMVFNGNDVYFSTHHGTPASESSNIQLQNIRVTNNLFFGESTAYNASPSMEIGYNQNQWIDDIQISGNTTVGNPKGAVGFGDQQDNLAFCVATRVVINNNICKMVTVGTSKGWNRRADVAGTNVFKCHVYQWDYNLDHNFATRYVGLTTQGTFTQGGNRYNEIAAGSRNVPGVALFDPSSASLSGSQLVFTYNSATDMTLAWGSGTGVQLVWGSGTVTGAGTNATNQLSAFLPIASSSAQIGNVACPSLYWVKITGDTTTPASVGQIRMIVANTTSLLTVVPKWTTLPSGAATYAIIYPEVTLTDGSDSVKAGIYLPDLPTASGTDTGISFADNSKANSDPLFINASGTTVDSYRWPSTSPAYNAGTSANAPSTDYYGSSRPWGSAPDIGFFELLYTPSTGTISLGALVVSGVGAGSTGTSGTGAVLLASLIASGTGRDIAAATGAVTLGPLTASGAGSFRDTATGAVALSPLTVSGVATSTDSASASGTITLGRMVVASAGALAAHTSGSILLSPMFAAGFSPITSGNSIGPLIYGGLVQMSKYYGDFLVGRKVRVEFNSVDVTAAPATLSAPQWKISKNGVDVTPSGGVTLTTDVGTVIGRNTLVIDMGADPATFAANADYAVRLTGTSNVRGISASGVTLGEWSVENRSVTVDGAGRVDLGYVLGTPVDPSTPPFDVNVVEWDGGTVGSAPPDLADIVAAVQTTAMTESYAAPGAEPSLAQALYLIQQRLTNVINTKGLITIGKLDPTATAAVLTTDLALPPTQSKRTS